MTFRYFGLVALLAMTGTLAAAAPSTYPATSAAHPALRHPGTPHPSTQAPRTQAPRTQAPKTTLTKNIDRTFPVNATGDLRLDNRYGEIRYRVGAGNEVRVAIRISAEAGNATKAQAILDRIDVRLDGAPSTVSVQTVMDGGVMSNSWSVFSNGDKGNRSFKINYDITAPAGFALDVKNRFGDTYLESMTAAAQIDVQYGNLTAGKLGSPSKVEVAFGDGTIGDVKSLDAKVKYGKLRMGNSAQAKVYARFSELTMGRIGTLDLDSQYSQYGIQSVRTFSNAGGFDDLKVDSVWSLDMKGGYCDVKLGYLGDDAGFVMNFGDVHIQSTSAVLKKLNFDGTYTDFTATIHPSVQYRLTAENKYGEIRTPAGFTMVREISKNTSEQVEGHHGANPKAEFVLKSSYGDLVLR